MYLWRCIHLQAADTHCWNRWRYLWSYVLHNSVIYICIRVKWYCLCFGLTTQTWCSGGWKWKNTIAKTPRLYGMVQWDFCQDEDSMLIRGWSKHTAVINELMIPGVIPEPTLCMIPVSCILDPITGIHDPGAYFPHSWLFVPPHRQNGLTVLWTGWATMYRWVEMVEDNGL